MAGDKLDPMLRRCVVAGLMTEAEALAVDAYTDGIAWDLVNGEITREQAEALVTARAEADAAKRGKA